MSADYNRPLFRAPRTSGDLIAYGLGIAVYFAVWIPLWMLTSDDGLAVAAWRGVTTLALGIASIAVLQWFMARRAA